MKNTLIVFSLSLFLMLGLNGQEKKIDFHQEIEPLLAKYCYQCHGPDKQKSGIRIDTMNPDMLKGQHGGKWREILDAIDRGDMPPDDEPLPSDPERELISEWMSSELDRSAKALRSTGGHVTLRRLTGYEYTNTMKDLLGVDLDFSKNLPPDTKGIDGYKNNGFYLGFSSLQLEEYYAAARKGLNAAIVQGSAPKESHARLLSLIRQNLIDTHWQYLMKTWMVLSLIMSRSNPGPKSQGITE